MNILFQPTYAALLLLGACSIFFPSCGKDDDDDIRQDAVTISVKAIDLGLSVKWANCNVGASSPEQYGGLYGWADPTGTKTSENDDDYYSISNSSSNISGTSYDIAHVKWGDGWRLPTLTEQTELFTQCSWTWITYHSVNGYKVIGPNRNSIFLPAAGYRDGCYVSYQGLSGSYWPGTIKSGRITYLYLDSNDAHFANGIGYPHYGLSVRPVTE